jgi:hypothetical protein
MGDSRVREPQADPLDPAVEGAGARPVYGRSYGLPDRDPTEMRRALQAIFSDLAPSPNLHHHVARGEPLTAFELHPYLPIYGPYNRVLFAGDGMAHARSKLEARFPEKTIISTDRFPSGRGVPTVISDHKDGLPFKDNSFDLIMMNRGLCFCPGRCCSGGRRQMTLARNLAPSCGGIPVDRQSRLGFLRDAARVLDKNNPRSIALLEGAAMSGLPDFVEAHSRNLWVDSANELAAEMGDRIRVTVLWRPEVGRDEYGRHVMRRDFYGIALTLKQTDPTAFLDQLTALHPQEIIENARREAHAARARAFT